MNPLMHFSDEDATRTIQRALRTLAVLVVVGVPLLGWKLGWPTAGLFAVGAAISAASLWKWLRLMVVALAYMDVPAEGADASAAPAKAAKPMGPVLVGFFLTLGLSVVVLYGSLKYLDGSVYALAAGLTLGVFALVIEALRLVKAWTV